MFAISERRKSGTSKLEEVSSPYSLVLSFKRLIICSFSHLYCELRSLTGFMRINAQRYLSLLSKLSEISLAIGCTGPAPISKMVRLLVRLLENHSENYSSCLTALESIQPMSSLRFMFGRTGYLHLLHVGIDFAKPAS